MRWCREGELAELWGVAGLRHVRFGPLVVRASYAGFEDLWSPLPTGVAPSGAFCKSLDADRRAALRDTYRRQLGVSDGQGTGRVYVNNRQLAGQITVLQDDGPACVPTSATPTPDSPTAAPKCKGRKALKGTRKRDVIVGTSGRDRISTGGGNDLVCARGGNDTVKGGPGQDKLYGEGGKDRLFGRPEGTGLSAAAEGTG